MPNHDLLMPEFRPNIERAHVRDVMRKVTFLDIETSLLELYTFRLGMQRPGIDSLKKGSQTKLLTAAWGTWWDMYNEGAEGVYYYGNHHNAEKFAADPIDDTDVLALLWDVLDRSDVIVAHNAAFDRGWVEATK